MSKPFSKLASVLLAFISVMQLARFIMGWVVTINGLSVPLWASLVACMVLGGLAVQVWREAK